MSGPIDQTRTFDANRQDCPNEEVPPRPVWTCPILTFADIADHTGTGAFGGSDGLGPLTHS
jgi:hypothetical protein